jgi:hypothetical protein
MSSSQRSPITGRPANPLDKSTRDIWTALGVVVSAVGIIATIIIAYRGWQRTADDQITLEAKTATDQIKLEQKKASIQFVSDQIHYLYGPLYSYMLTSTDAWASFRAQYRPGKAFWGSPAPSEDEKRAWVLWMKTVFVPLNENMAKTILENAHLIDSKEMPGELTQFLLHVETYRPVISGWERGDFSKTTSAINYPPGFNKYICETFIRLKMHQAELLGLPDVKTQPVNCDDLGKAPAETAQAPTNAR